MANVFTKRSKIPRTTTLGDFGYRSQALRQLSPGEPEVTRILSPTRRQNPQPVGLVYQSPYNRYNNVFGIWNPNMMMPVMRCGRTLPHLPPVRRKQPEVHYSIATVQRTSYQWPPEVPEKFRGMVNHTRFGLTPWKNVVGIVPSAITQLPCPNRTSHSGDEGRVSNRVPRPPSGSRQSSRSTSRKSTASSFRLSSAEEAQNGIDNFSTHSYGSGTFHGIVAGA